MKGTYKIPIGSSKGYYNRYKPAPGWSAFTAVCRSLAADGLEYSIKIVIDTNPHILIVASGTAKRRKNQPIVLKFKPSEPLKNEKCCRELSEAEKVLKASRARMACGLDHYAESEAARLDVEYWQEMERISGQREHFKPGMDRAADATRGGRK